MKKISSLCLMILLLYSFVLPVKANEENTYQLYINGKKFDYAYPPIVYHDAVYVPLWGTMSAMNVTTYYDDMNDVFRINLNDRVLLLSTNSNLIYRYNLTSIISSNLKKSRTDYPPILNKSVVYVPLVFLSEYMDFGVEWGDNSRIDITTRPRNIGNDAWEKLYNQVNAGQRQLNFEAKAEVYWKHYPLLWVNKSYYTLAPTDHLDQVAVIGYAGGDVTLSANGYTWNKDFHSLSEMYNSFYGYDPFEGTEWLDSIKNIIKQEKVKIGMNKDQARLAWGDPDKINTDIYSSGVHEQWIYRHASSNSYLYFKNGILTSASD